MKNINGFTKINKQKAKRLYNEGKKIYIVPVKVYPDFKGQWIKPFELQYTNEMKQRDVEYPGLAFEHTFDSRINNFEYYNCNPELGNYTAFYIITE
jgi:hypothetical protein